DGKIVFPEDFDRVPVCKGSTYCEKVDSYPENIVTNAIQQNESLRYLAGVDVVSDIAQRIDVMDDVPLCVSSEQVIFPQTAENKDNQWKYIANQENFKQGVRIEKCNKENTRCSVIGGPGEGYKTSCRQKYVYRQLAAVLSDGTVIPDTFKFPSSCCCHVTF
ncbi:Protein spaetzle, partial [Dufourea novaeangliae]